MRLKKERTMHQQYKIKLLEEKMKKIIGKIIVISAVAIFGISTLALADWGRGHGRMMGPNSSGSGWHNGSGYGHGNSGYNNNLSAEDIEKIDQQRAEYFKATENIRQELYQKNLALRSELAKTNPDINKASGLQSEISKRQGELDQKRLEYEMQARNTVPQYNRGYRGNGPMMGYGSRGGGNCMW